jgi:hypothetical protein
MEIEPKAQRPPSACLVKPKDLLVPKVVQSQLRIGVRSEERDVRLCVDHLITRGQQQRIDQHIRAFAPPIATGSVNRDAVVHRVATHYARCGDHASLTATTSTRVKLPSELRHGLSRIAGDKNYRKWLFLALFSRP